MADNSALEVLVQSLRRLPGVGAKSASRMAFHLLQHDRPGALALSHALKVATDSVRHCERCNTFTQAEVCAVCLDARRDASKLCVVETPLFLQLQLVRALLVALRLARVDIWHLKFLMQKSIITQLIFMRLEYVY